MHKMRYALAAAGLLLAGSAAAQVTPPAPSPAPPPADPKPAPAVPVPTKPVPYGAGMKVNLSPDGSKYVRFITWTQLYARYNENNSNTYRAPGLLKSDQLDFGIRRARLIVLSQLNPRFLVLVHLGINNQNTVSGGAAATTDGKKPQIFFHEAYGDFKVNKYLNIGGGLHYYNGISRLTSASVNSILPMDIPLTNFPTIDAIDQFARWIGVFAHGRVGKFDYRFSVSDPFLTNLPTASNLYATTTTSTQAGTPLALGSVSTVTNSAGGTVVTNTGTNVANYNPQNDSHVYQGYVTYNFLETESNLLPYYTGTYLGAKRVLNLGVGALINPHGMYSRPTNSAVVVSSSVAGTSGIPVGTDLYNYAPFQTQQNTIKLYGADIFYDTPLDTASARKTALTFYGVYYNFDFGPNYTRAVGPENPGYVNIGSSAAVTNYRGNAYPQSGTGQAVYGQLGYLMSKRILGPKLRLQPYVAYMFSHYDGYKALDGSIQNANLYDAGVNFLLDGHNAKLTLNYRERPDFSNQTAIANGVQINEVKYRPEVTLQMQFML